MKKEKKIVVNPTIILREEFDDWAVLFDPDSGNGFGLNPTSIFIWKQLDGNHTINDILTQLQENCIDIDEKVEEHINEFIQDLVQEGLVTS